ncbi:MAG TPA: hypothetical protein PLB52_00790 [Candidatus Moranbacteria bacterium]|nr:hypothetical protein [Candidatus Moranbacteria bacterium]
MNLEKRKLLLEIAKEAEEETRELLAHFNSKELRERCPDSTERLKASCPEKFMGGPIFTMRSALKLRKDVLTVILRGFLNGKHDDEAKLLDEKLCAGVRGLLASH